MNSSSIFAGNQIRGIVGGASPFFMASMISRKRPIRWV